MGQKGAWRLSSFSKFRTSGSVQDSRKSRNTLIGAAPTRNGPVASGAVGLNKHKRCSAFTLTGQVWFFGQVQGIRSSMHDAGQRLTSLVIGMTNGHGCSRDEWGNCIDLRRPILHHFTTLHKLTSEQARTRILLTRRTISLGCFNNTQGSLRWNDQS